VQAAQHRRRDHPIVVGQAMTNEALPQTVEHVV
jgi:hypothetical protein